MECIICLEMIEDENNIIEAKHNNVIHNNIYCKNCWKEYIKLFNKCPICRAPLLQQEESNFFCIIIENEENNDISYLYLVIEGFMYYFVMFNLNEFSNQRIKVVDNIIKSGLVVYFICRLLFFKKYKVAYFMLFSILCFSLGNNFSIYIYNEYLKLDNNNIF